MKLHTAWFSIELKPRRSVDDEDWIRVWADAAVGPFSGGLEVLLQLEDLRQFKQQVELLHAKVGTPSQAVLSCFEPGIYVELKSDRLGSITGTCRLEDEVSGAELSGAFAIDQSYLPQLALSIEELIEAVRV